MLKLLSDEPRHTACVDAVVVRVALAFHPCRRRFVYREAVVEAAEVTVVPCQRLVEIDERTRFAACRPSRDKGHRHLLLRIWNKCVLANQFFLGILAMTGIDPIEPLA